MKIRKTIVQVTVLHYQDENLSDVSLEDIAYQISEGDWLGTKAVVSSEIVPADKVRSESIAVGNDGEFFAGLDE